MSTTNPAPTEQRARYQPRTLGCIDCDAQFTFTPGEQAYFAEQGLASPKRCKDCRAERKRLKDERARMGAAESAAGYDAICAKCGAPFKLPFPPARQRAYYCRPCFREES